ncbi:unnamed protein product (macronuclear) [Paramecium tetraurelia]|uniref:Uncharacterized protein n=1 Tax=Paramecium tetraurelia TaxID=5888 RepID=A0CDN3_PARTE|nr:uncharacterized protein GSPATT00007111001 [Paramecium tetraurelia]CAK68900.1 unnamed protein product [Paramecium tetraurelia]|eukprot:XP_001436297.1 hypothetical protein (macronuclear) [Paramecium tetraurelia strain d4-2]
MNFIKSIFSKSSTSQFQQKSKNQASEFSILDPQFTQVRLRDAKLLIADLRKLEQVLNYQPQTINEQLKKCYALHIILSSDQYQVIDKVVYYCEQNQIKPIRQNIQTKTAATTNINQTCQIMSDQQMIATQFQNSMYLNVSDQLQFYEQIHQNESEFTNNYFNYIQRVTQNSDIYNSCKFHQYPYEDETFNRKLQFVWLFKIINMLNYKLAFIPNLKFLFNCKTQNSFIIRDVAYLVYKDCLLEYGFLRNEISDMVESYSQFQVRESLQFYELVVFMLEINKKMKIFYDMRQQFALNSQSVRDIKWFEIDKKQLIEIEHYTSKAKLLNTVQFKKSLMVPTQKNQMENLQKIMLDSSLLENSFMKEPTTAKYNKKNNAQQYSPLNSKQTRISNHSRQLSKN